MGGAFSWMMVLLMALSQGSGNVMDFVSTEAYWKIKNIPVSEQTMTAELAESAVSPDVAKDIADLGADDFPTRQAARQRLEAAGAAALEPLKKAEADTSDPEVKGVCLQLIKRLESTGKQKEIRRLMAIRTLGELKAKGTLATLQPLTTAKDPFVSLYARRAVAAIEGKAFAMPANVKAWQEDVHYLPADCGLVAQYHPFHDKPRTVEQLLEGLPEKALAGSGQTKGQLAMRLQEQIIQALERIGPVYLESLTLGVAENVGPEAGYVVLMARGKFDPATLSGVLSQATSRKAAMRGEADEAVKKESGISVFPLDRDASLLMSGDSRLVLVAGPNNNMDAARKVMIAALSAGKGSFAESKTLAKPMRDVDFNQPLWAVCAVSDAYRKWQTIAPFSMLRLSSKMDQGITHVTIKGEAGEGVEKEKVQASVEEIHAGVQKALEMAKGIPEPMAEASKPMVEFLQSVACKAEDTGATLSADVKLEGIMSSVSMFFMGMPMIH